MTSFQINVSDFPLQDLEQRLARSRFPDQVDGTDWDYGTELGYLKELAHYWRTKSNWRKQEQTLNQFSQFKTKIDDVNIHFIYVHSKEENALPLLLNHGCPGSVFEFHKVIGPLTYHVAHGGDWGSGGGGPRGWDATTAIMWLGFILIWFTLEYPRTWKTPTRASLGGS